MKEYGCQKWQNVSHSGYETGRQFSNENEFAGGSAMNFNEAALKLHEEHHGKIEVVSKVPVKTRDDLSTAYTPGVAEPCRKIHDNKKDVYKYTAKGNLVAVVSDGTAVLGLGNIGPEAAMPVMEGKAVLFKEFGGVDAFPICLDTTDTEEIIKAVKYIAPCFGGINLEDIASPKCFEVEARLEKELDIPVFHDDQHGTAVVVTAALLNALKVVGKKINEIHVVLNGPGSAGTANAFLIISLRFSRQSLRSCAWYLMSKSTPSYAWCQMIRFFPFSGSNGKISDTKKSDSGQDWIVVSTLVRLFLISMVPFSSDAKRNSFAASNASFKASSSFECTEK